MKMFSVSEQEAQVLIAGLKVSMNKIWNDDGIPLDTKYSDMKLLMPLIEKLEAVK